MTKQTGLLRKYKAGKVFVTGVPTNGRMELPYATWPHSGQVKVGIPYAACNEAGWFDKEFTIPLRLLDKLRRIGAKSVHGLRGGNARREALAYAWLAFASRLGVEVR